MSTELLNFPEVTFRSKTLSVDGSRMHYVDEGQGKPFLFLHGVPTSGYLWRHVIAEVLGVGRCIAVDMIGMGKSDKPDIDYTVFDHIRYIENFIIKLGLREITLVMHAWGSVIGSDIAMRRPELFNGLVFIESHLRPETDWSTVALPMQEMVSGMFRTGEDGYDRLMKGDYYINKVIQNGLIDKLGEDEMQHYREPFKTPGSCKPLWQYGQDFPSRDGPEEVIVLIKNYSDRLQNSSLPKLLLYAFPGFNTTIETVIWARDHLPNLTVKSIEDALHFVPESNPKQVAEELIEWNRRIFF